MNEKVQVKDLYYDLLKEPSREKFRQFLEGNTGEQNNIDFKSEWIEKSALSKLFLSLGNSGGGIIVFGIKENGDGTTEPIGLDKFLDSACIDDMIKKYIPTTLKYERLNFSFDTSEYAKLQGKKFQVIQTKNTPEALPYVSLAQTTDLQQDTIYIRRGTKCVKANSEELEKIINRRIETQFSSSSVLNLEEHLNQLKLLYGEIEKYEKILIEEGTPTEFGKLLLELGLFVSTSLTSNSKYDYKVNPAYPEEDYEKFIGRMIKNKKSKIEKVLDIK